MTKYDTLHIWQDSFGVLHYSTTKDTKLNYEELKELVAGIIIHYKATSEKWIKKEDIHNYIFYVIGDFDSIADIYDDEEKIRGNINRNGRFLELEGFQLGSGAICLVEKIGGE